MIKVTDKELIEIWSPCAPMLEIASPENGIYACDECLYLEEDDEADSCSKHEGMSHDMDMNPNIDFVRRLRCKDWS